MSETKELPVPTSTLERFTAAFAPIERQIRRETLWVPVLSSVGWGLSMVSVIWSGVVSGTELTIPHCMVLAFAIMMSWFYWDVDARRRVAHLKYQTAAGLLTAMVDEYDWEWGKSTKPGSVCLSLPREDSPETTGDDRL